MKPKINRSYRWPRPQLWLLLLGARVADCANGGQTLLTTSVSPRPAVTVKWLPPCSSKLTEPYFSVDVFSDGMILYIGGSQAREVGERRVQVTTKKAQQLIRIAQQSATGSRLKVKRSPEEASNLEIPDMCLEVTTRYQLRANAFRGANEEVRMQGVFKEFGSVVTENKWVCPTKAQYQGTGVGFDAYRFCGGYKGRPAMHLEYVSKDCVSLGVSVYPDVIYFKKMIKTNDGVFVVAHEGHQRISDAEFAKVVLETQLARLAKPDLEEPNPRIDSDYVSDYVASPEDLSRIANTLVLVLKPSAVTITGATEACDKPDLSGGIVLRYEYGPPRSN